MVFVPSIKKKKLFRPVGEVRGGSRALVVVPMFT